MPRKSNRRNRSYHLTTLMKEEVNPGARIVVGVQGPIRSRPPSSTDEGWTSTTAAFQPLIFPPLLSDLPSISRSSQKIFYTKRKTVLARSPVIFSLVFEHFDAHEARLLTTQALTAKTRAWQRAR